MKQKKAYISFLNDSYKIRSNNFSVKFDSFIDVVKWIMSNNKPMNTKVKKATRKSVSLKTKHQIVSKENNFFYDIRLFLIKLIITFIFIILTVFFSANIISKSIQSNLNESSLFSQINFTLDRIDHFVNQTSDELSEIRPLEKLESEIIGMAKPEHEIPIEKQEEIIKSIKVLKKRIKPFLDALKD